MISQDKNMFLKKRSEHYSGWIILRALLPYIWMHKQRVLLAMLCMVSAKLAGLAIPVTFKHIIDYFHDKPSQSTFLVVPVFLICAYGLLRLSVNILSGLRDALFDHVNRAVARIVASKTFEHLHSLSLNFHLSRRSGGITREISLGMAGIKTLMSRLLVTILPLIIEIALVLAYLAWHYPYLFFVIISISLAAYIAFTIVVTNWRTQYKRELNQLDAEAAACAADSLVNFETVKYFNNEIYEKNRYDAILEKKEDAASRVLHSFKFLSAGQQFIIVVAMIFLLWYAANGVVQGSLSLGDLVLINTFLVQLYSPLSSLGVTYREIKQSFIDLEKMYAILNSPPEITDQPSALPLQCQKGEVHFRQVDFSYQPGGRKILHHLEFRIPAGHTVAVVGHSGAGKSTLAKLLFRFYDVEAGQILIDGQNIRSVTQASLRQAIAIVPQDTVLFNDTIGHNIAYARVGAGQHDIEAATRSAHIHEFIMSLPQGYETMVGERGLKLSGGEKQRIAIARALLKNPEILIFDEATSSLDSRSEQAIQLALDDLAQKKTTLIIAHRLSTVIHAHQILVMDHGRIVERGTHAELLARGQSYAALWFAQQNGHCVGDASVELSASAEASALLPAIKAG
ncbi:ABC transporter ATP-binding protein/permease [Noviherbaspirillum sp. 1P10PC]|uniref:ABCB family ABC transporter ATP-binding protein/permease n=1 Tax=Noviherbaspirillum sp. 1P10PC TaxID=3132292 RepID=UPI0039A2073A